MLQVALFTNHANDPLSFAIKAIMRTSYTHAALRVSDTDIIEAYWPMVRRRALNPGELAGIDLFNVVGLTPEREAGVLAFCNLAIAHQEHYSVANLFRFLPFARPMLGEATDASPGSNPVFCSQFVFDALTHGGGIPIFSNETNSYEVDPGHLAWSPNLTIVPK